MMLSKADLRGLVAADLVRVDGAYSLDEQYKFQHFTLVDGLRDDGWCRYAIIRRNGELAYVPLHPYYDRLVFQYVPGCFYPRLVATNFNVDRWPVDRRSLKLYDSVKERYIVLDDTVHPEYSKFLVPRGAAIK